MTQNDNTYNNMRLLDKYIANFNAIIWSLLEISFLIVLLYIFVYDLDTL